VLLVALGCALVLSLLAFGRLHSQFGVEAMHETQAYKQQIDRFDALLALVLDAETGVRGYLLNEHKRSTSSPTRRAGRNIGPLLARIDQDYPPGSTDRQEVEMLAG
jgi:CHASE3 domain sensor protein